jgi:formylglycine-generating enzyme required for sulfatase activity
MADVGGTCVDRFEAHLLEDLPAGDTRRHPHYERPRADARYRAASARGVFPQAYVSRVEASAACGAAGKRLCTRAEWQRACRHVGKGTFPYAGAARAGACNTGKPHLLPILFPERGYVFRYDDHFNSPELNTTEGFLARSGAFSQCASDAGVHDMVGNLHEWVEDIVTAQILHSLDTDGIRRQWQPGRAGNGVFLGGFYSTQSEHGPGCMFITVAHEPSYHDYSTGFRCCMDSAREMHDAALAAPPTSRRAR